MLPLENSSDKMFDPGPGGHRDPAAAGVRGRRGAGERRARSTCARTTAWRCTASSRPSARCVGTTTKNAGNEVVFGFVAPLPWGHARVRPADAERDGALHLDHRADRGPDASPGRGSASARSASSAAASTGSCRSTRFAPGGVLAFTLNGLPATDATGRNVAGRPGAAAGRRRGGLRPAAQDAGKAAKRRRRGDASATRLVDRREATFAELVALERDGARRRRRRGAGRPAQAAGRTARADLPRPGGAGRTARGMTDVGAAPLRLSKVGKIYGGRRALADVSATFEPGRIAAVLGPNGAGKSTLLGILSTLVAPSAGEVRWGDERARARLAAARAHRLRRARARALRRSDRHREPDAVRARSTASPSRAARAAALLARVGLAEAAADGAGAHVLARDAAAAGAGARAGARSGAAAVRRAGGGARSGGRRLAGRASSPPSARPGAWWCW